MTSTSTTIVRKNELIQTDVRVEIAAFDPIDPDRIPHSVTRDLDDHLLRTPTQTALEVRQILWGVADRRERNGTWLGADELVELRVSVLDMSAGKTHHGEALQISLCEATCCPDEELWRLVHPLNA